MHSCIHPTPVLCSFPNCWMSTARWTSMLLRCMHCLWEVLHAETAEAGAGMCVCVGFCIQECLYDIAFWGVHSGSTKSHKQYCSMYLLAGCREYRDARKIPLNVEHRMMLGMAPDYDHLMVIQKVEVFQHALDSTSGTRFVLLSASASWLLPGPCLQATSGSLCLRLVCLPVVYCDNTSSSCVAALLQSSFSCRVASESCT